jgi:hypothetical protein
MKGIGSVPRPIRYEPMKPAISDYLRTGTAPRTPCVAALFQATANVSGVAMAELAAESGLLTRALLDTHRLLGAESVAVRFDGVIRQAAGEEAWPSGGMGVLDLPPVAPDLASTEMAAATMLDTVTRLSAELKRATPVIAYLPAPLLVEDGGEPVAGQWSALVRALVEMACKAGAGLVMLRAQPGVDGEILARHLKPISNVARYYGKAVLLVDAAAPKSLADAVILPPAADTSVLSGPRIGRHLSPDMMEEGSGRFPVGPDEFAFLEDDFFTERLAADTTSQLIALSQIIGGS